MIDIPQNDAADLIARKNAEHQKELDSIAKYFLAGLKKHDAAEVDCTPHMIGRDFGEDRSRHLEDAIEAARMFKEKGYYCYYYNGYNGCGVNQRAVRVCKAPMTDAEIHWDHWDWIPI